MTMAGKWVTMSEANLSTISNSLSVPSEDIAQVPAMAASNNSDAIETTVQQIQTSIQTIQDQLRQMHEETQQRMQQMRADMDLKFRTVTEILEIE